VRDPRTVAWLLGKELIHGDRVLVGLTVSLALLEVQPLLLSSSFFCHGFPSRTSEPSSFLDGITPI
jgi:hypothetical protein